MGFGGIIGAALNIGGGTSGIGKLMNNLTGVTSSSKQAYQQTAALQNMSYEQQKEFAQNAHQWEMKDLAKAGLNPALTTQASSAGAVAGGGSTGGQGNVGTSGGTPMEMIQALNTTSATQHQNELYDQQANLFSTQAMQIIQNLPIDIKTKQEMLKKLGAETGLIRKQTGLAKQEEATSRARRQEHYANAWYQKNRSLGFSESKTYSASRGGSFFGTGVNSSNSRTNAKTW